MNKQLSALPDSKTTRIMLPYNRQYVIFAVYEVLDKNGAEYEKTDASTILTKMSVYGNLSRFSVSVNEQESGTVLTVTMVHPCEGLSDAGIRRATTAIADSISQHLENELEINKVFVQKTTCLKFQNGGNQLYSASQTISKNAL